MPANHTSDRELELVPGIDKKCKPLFESREAYEAFCADFHRQVAPALRRHHEARILSEEAARHHLVY
jgi:hypothetical protein